MQAFQALNESEGQCTCSCHATGLRARPATPFLAELPDTPPPSAASVQSASSSLMRTSASSPPSAFPFDSPPPLDWTAALQARSRRINGGNLTVPNKVKYDYCAFCRNNGEDESFVKSHTLKDDQGQVTCPVLSSYHCPVCGATGKLAHTIKYCKRNKLEQQTALLAMQVTCLQQSNVAHLRPITASREGRFGPVGSPVGGFGGTGGMGRNVGLVGFGGMGNMAGLGNVGGFGGMGNGGFRKFL